MQRAPLRAALARPGPALLALVAAGYATSLLGPFQFDDYGVIVNHPPAQSLRAWWEAAGRGLRPLLKLTYAMNWASGLGPAGFHAVNVLVHLANALLVLALFQAATERGPSPSTRPVTGGALLAAALFAVHPIQTEAVAYVSGRSASLSATFYLAALLAHARGARSGSAWRWAGLAPFLFVCALLVKETAATLPLAVLLWDVVVERPGARRLLMRQLLWWGLLAALLVLAISRRSYFSLLYNVLGAKPLAASVASQLEGVAYLARRIALAGPLSIDPGLGFLPPSPAARAVGVVVLGAAAYVGLDTRRSAPAVALGVLWFALHLFLPYALLPRDDVANERHAYLAMAGLAVAAGATWDRSPLRARHAIAAGRGAMALVAVLAALTARRGLDYRSEVALWESTVAASPANPRAHFNLGVALEANLRHEEALAEYRRALELHPGFERARGAVERAGGRPAVRPDR